MARGPQKLRFGGDCKGFLYLPRDEAPAGAVVILHERYGLVQHTLDLAQRLARDGYVALAPDLFSRWRGDQEALKRGEARVTLPDPEIAAVIDHALDFLMTHPRVAPSRIALMGVCQSGRYPIVIGSRRRDLTACVVFYGASQQRDWQISDLQPQPMQEMMRRLAAPALFVFGERDHTISLADVRRTRDALEEGRCSYRMKIFRDMAGGRTGALGIRRRELRGLRLLEEREAAMTTERLDPARTALLFFDMLNGHVRKDDAATKARYAPVIAAAVRLLEAARRSGLV